MTEQEEFEFRLRLERERGAQAPSPLPPLEMQHLASGSTQMPRQPSSLADFGRGAWKGLQDIGMGAQQRGYELVGSPQADALRQQVKDQRAAAEQEALLKGPPSLAYGLGEVGAKTAPMVGASFLPGGQSLTGAALIGTLGGALEPSESTGETVRNAGLSGISSWLTSLGMRAAMPRTNVTEADKIMGKAAEHEDVRLTGGQRTGLDYVKRAEAHALWNPLTRGHARSVATEQSDYFIRGLLKRAGLKDHQIPEHPTLSPELLGMARAEAGRELDQNFANKVYTLPEFDRAFNKARQLTLFAAGDRAEQQMVRDMADRALQFSNPAPGARNIKIRGELVQELLQDIKQSVDKLYTAGSKRGAEKLKDLYDNMVGGLKDPGQYRQAVEIWAHLKTSEELLRTSPQMGRGIPDPTKLGKVVERNMPGGVLYNQSPMADLARAGEATKGSGALPERVTGIPRMSDLANAATYYRFNNPAALQGFKHPRMRDIAETLTRYLPYNAGASDTVSEETKRMLRVLRGE